MLSQVSTSQNSRQMTGNIHNDLQPFACIITEKFNNTQKMNLAIISGKKVKKSVEKRQHKIKQTNYLQVLKETSKKDRVELKPYIHEAIL